MGVGVQPGAPSIARRVPHAVDEQLTGSGLRSCGVWGGRVCSQVLCRLPVIRPTGLTSS